MSDTNKAVLSLNTARGLKFQILKVEGFCFQCSVNKGADQLRGFTAKLICIFVFAYTKIRFSHDAARIMHSAKIGSANKVITFFMLNSTEHEIYPTHKC